MPNVVGVDIPFPEPFMTDLQIDNNADRDDMSEFVLKIWTTQGCWHASRFSLPGFVVMEASPVVSPQKPSAVSVADHPGRRAA